MMKLIFLHPHHPSLSSTWETIQQQFIGGSAQLRHPEMTSSGVDRYRLNTVSMGTVHLSLGVILRNFEKYGIEF